MFIFEKEEFKQKALKEKKETKMLKRRITGTQQNLS